MPIKNMKVAVKLMGGFLLIALIMVGYTGYVVIQVQGLNTLQIESAKMTRQAIAGGQSQGDLAAITAAINQAEQAYGNASRSIWVTSFIWGLVVVLAAVLLGIYTSRSLTRPLNKIIQAAKGISRGELNQELAVQSRDELGQLSAVFQEIVGYLNHMAAIANKVSGKDLTQEINPYSEQDVLGNAFKELVNDLRATMQRLAEDTEVLSVASEQVGHAGLRHYGSNYSCPPGSVIQSPGQLGRGLAGGQYGP